MEEVFVVLLESEGDWPCWAVCRTLEGAMGTVAAEFDHLYWVPDGEEPRWLAFESPPTPAQMEEWRWYAKAAVQRMGVKP